MIRNSPANVAEPGTASAAEEQGREIVFSTTVGQPALKITKTYRLLKGADVLLQLPREALHRVYAWYPDRLRERRCPKSATPSSTASV